ncbi:MAG: hypothetical protein QW810_07015 [Nitrososphaerota archaeon]
MVPSLRETINIGILIFSSKSLKPFPVLRLLLIIVNCQLVSYSARNHSKKEQLSSLNL